MRPEFAVHMLNDTGKKKAAEIANEFSGLLIMLERITANESSREMSIVRTKLEEASFYAKKAMANQKVNQE